MNLIERYVHAIGRRLPQKNRSDIEKEIRSALEDMLEDRSKKENRAIDEELTIQVLKEHGKPEKVAASYMPERYLVGPRLFPTFWMIVKIVFAVLTSLAIVGLVIRLVNAEPLPAEVGGIILNTFGEYFGGMMSAFGNIVLVFALIQYFVPDLKFEDKQDEEWNPRELPDVVEERDQFSLGGTIAETVFIVLGLALFNIYPEYIGIYGFTEAGRFFAPVLSEAFFRYMPWINLIWGLQIAMNAWLMQQMRWTEGTRWLLVAIKAGSIALALALLRGPSISALTPESLMTNMSFSADSAQIFANLFGQAIKIALWITVVVGVVDIAKTLVKIVRGQVSPVAAG